MCDVYVTPYLNEAQMTSGTLAYSFGLGKAVVSTPYWHARELLADGRGILVPFGDSAAIGSEIAALLTDEPDGRRCASAPMQQPLDDMGANRRALPGGVRARAAGSSARSDCTRSNRTRSAPRSRAAPEMRTRPFSLDVRRHRPVPARRPFRARPLPRLLRRRQRPRACCWRARSTSQASSACPKR